MKIFITGVAGFLGSHLADQMLAEGHTPILLASPVLRPTLFAFLAPMIQEIVVLSYHDLLSDVQVDIVGQVTFEEMQAAAA